METSKTRGYLPADERFFAPEALSTLAAAQADLRYLLDHGYPLKSALTFTGNHYQLSVRQRVALARSTDSAACLCRRLEKRLTPQDMSGQPAYVDGLNLIITLEVALSDGMLFRAQDGVIRDLAELRGTYRLIPQTKTAIAILRNGLTDLHASEVVVYLDAPVSNSGRLKAAFFEEPWPMPVRVELVPNPDAVLKQCARVISGDSVILDECVSWFNAVAWLMDTQKALPELSQLVDLGECSAS